MCDRFKHSELTSCRVPIDDHESFCQIAPAIATLGDLAKPFGLGLPDIIRGLNGRAETAMNQSAKFRKDVEHLRAQIRILLKRLWPRWRAALLIVQPETVVRWHRAGFRHYWRWKSRPKGGRKPIDQELRMLIRRLCREVPLHRAVELVPDQRACTVAAGDGGQPPTLE